MNKKPGYPKMKPAKRSNILVSKKIKKCIYRFLI